jgi:hypothetical protein
MNPKEVAQTIKEQLGLECLFLLAAKNLSYGIQNEIPYLQFKIGDNSKKITHIKIRLDAMDEYVVEFYKIPTDPSTITEASLEPTSTFSRIQWDGLKDLIEEETGLYVSLHQRS